MDAIALIQLFCYAVFGVAFAAMASASIRVGLALVILASFWRPWPTSCR